MLILPNRTLVRLNGFFLARAGGLFAELWGVVYCRCNSLWGEVLAWVYLFCTQAEV